MANVERPDGAWHLDKRVNLGHLLTTLSVAASLAVWATTMDKRIAVLEERAQAQKDRDAAQDQTLQRALANMAEEMREMREAQRETNRKLDRLIESRTPPRP